MMRTTEQQTSSLNQQNKAKIPSSSAFVTVYITGDASISPLSRPSASNMSIKGCTGDRKKRKKEPPGIYDTK